MSGHDARPDGPVQTEPRPSGRAPSEVVGGRFEIERLIARGGMGSVYLAHQLNLGRPVALKIMTPPPDDDGLTFAERFRLEAETLAALHHENIVTVYDYGPTADDRFYLAMEYIDGPRFTDLIRTGPMPPQRVIGLMVQVCNALGYAHRHGVVHRDLKPSNLLVRVEDGVETVKVVDFGLVKVAEADPSLTRAGLVLGSPHCMAPEQVRGDVVDLRADLYAIGVLLFRALTGSWPFHGETVAATMIAHVHQPRPTFFSVAPDLMLPVGLEDIAQRCMRREAADRYPDAAALRDALVALHDVPEGDFLAVSTYPSGQPAAVAADDVQTGRRWLLPLVVAAALLAVVSVLGLWRPWEAPITLSPNSALPVVTAPSPGEATEVPEPAAQDTPAGQSPSQPQPQPQAQPNGQEADKLAAPPPVAEGDAPAGELPLPDDF